MANASGIDFQGIEELGQVLDGLPGRFGDQVVDKILRKAAQPLIQAAKQNSSHADVTGDTTKSIGIIANRKANSITVGPRRGGPFKGWHAHILEYGAAPHTIRAKPGQVLVWNGGAAYQVEHPGIAAQPFMRPAYDATKGAVVDSIKAQCAEIITTEFKSVSK